MENLVRKLLLHRRTVIVVFMIAAIISAVLAPKVGVNFDMAKYLPEDAPSTKALDTMLDVYDSQVPNTRVMVSGVDLVAALDYKNRIAEVAGVSAIAWLGDQINIYLPLEVQNQAAIADWYKNGNALFSVTVEEESKKETLSAIRDIIGPDGAMSGNTVDIIGAQKTTSTEVMRVAVFIVPIIMIILCITTTSWFESVLFMVNVGLAVLLNLGTNIIFGEISFITNATGAILQLACSMDYAIFLLDRFEEQRELGLEPVEAMTQSVMKSSSSILSSGLTTVVGFLALVAMRFKLGPDMGYVLAKGIGISLLTTLVFMPCLTIFCYRIIERTHHRSFMPTFATLARGANKIKGIVTICVVILLIPCYLAQQRIPFVYGTSGLAAPESQIATDKIKIDEAFGESLPFVIMIPGGSTVNELALCGELKAMPEVTSVTSYVETIGKEIPSEFLPREMLSQLNAGGYTRIMINARVPAESGRTFVFIEKLRDAAHRYYPENSYVAGEAVNVYDIKDTIQSDSVAVNLIAIGAIAVILLVTFRSVSLPVLLLITIESSIFINVAIPYFMGSSFNYIGFLIISSIQLGATIDYAILFANRYYENRACLKKNDAAFRTIQNTAGSIIASASVMTTAGLVLGLISTNSVISQLGILVARGAILSAMLVLVMLPTLLTIFEPVIIKTTKGLKISEKLKASAKGVTL